MRAILVTIACAILIGAGPAFAKPSLIDCNREGCHSVNAPRAATYKQRRYDYHKPHAKPRYAARQHSYSRSERATKQTRGLRGTQTAQILPHPTGCPRRAFCGCGVSLKVFGKPVAAGGLAIAAEWLRFPRAAPAPGMVAARRGHVFYIERVLGPRHVLAYDPNSGRRLTRRHVRSLAGYQVVNPRG